MARLYFFPNYDSKLDCLIYKSKKGFLFQGNSLCIR